uniref:Regulator of G protein signaling 14a n=1 Tax=Cynoglossus semilaevis TaxID=244447 RepID=A0A3P8VRJ7_CYNSE
MAKNLNALGIPVGHLVKLNMSARGCGSSSSSLPGTPGGEVSPANSVLSWAVSFEKLLEDPSGVRYFTSFLMSEVSAENILFYQACEKFKKILATSVDELKRVARSIYNTYLSDSAPYCVNIDDTAKIEEKDLEQPTSDMFNKAQSQIFKLMKMDSYRRFVRSPLYQKCTLASVEGKVLPELSNESTRLGSWEDVAVRSPLLGGPKVDRCRESEPRDSEVMHSLSYSTSSKKRGSWGGTSFQAKGGSSRAEVERGYCCVYLPDGSASLAPTRSGQPIKEMLSSLCEKRGFPLKDVIIYLHGKDKPLSLDQDCSVLRDQQVSLELRVMFALEIAFTGKTLGIMVKSSKTLQDALSLVMQKHHLKPQEAVVTMVGSDVPINMSNTVFKLANKTLRLDKATGETPQEVVLKSVSSTSGLMDMLSRAQCLRVDDQRGLLTKEQLEIPLFLQLPSDQGQDTGASESTEGGWGEPCEHILL